MGLTIDDIKIIIGDDIYTLLNNHGKIPELKQYVESDQFSLTEDQITNLFGEGDEDLDQADGEIRIWIDEYSIDNLRGSCSSFYALLNQAFEPLIRDICSIPKHVACTVTNDVITLTKAYLSVVKPEILQPPLHVQHALAYLFEENNFVLDINTYDETEIELTPDTLDNLLDIKIALEERGILSFDEFNKLTPLQQKFTFDFYPGIEQVKELFITNKECIVNLDEKSFLKLLHLDNKKPFADYLKRDKNCLPQILALDYSKILALLTAAPILLNMVDKNKISLENLLSLELIELTLLLLEGNIVNYSEEAEAIFARFTHTEAAPSLTL